MGCLGDVGGRASRPTTLRESVCLRFVRMVLSGGAPDLLLREPFLLAFVCLLLSGEDARPPTLTESYM